MRIVLTALLIFIANQVWAEGSLITKVEETGARISYCKRQVFADPEVQYAIDQNDRNRLAAAEAFLREYSKEKFGVKDAQLLETSALFSGAYMRWGKKKKVEDNKLMKDLPLVTKLQVLMWCRGAFLKE
jgi:hypothetical protein